MIGDMSLFIFGAIIGILLFYGLGLIINEIYCKNGYVENVTGDWYNVIGMTTLKNGSRVKILQSSKDAHIECVDTETLKSKFHKFHK